MGTMINMSVIMVAMGICVCFGNFSAIRQKGRLPEKWYESQWGKIFLVIGVGVTSIIIIDSFTPRSTFFPTVATVADVRHELLTTFYIVMAFCLILVGLRRVYAYCAPLKAEMWKPWPLVSKMFIGEQVVVTIIIAIVIAESNNDAAFLEIMGATNEPIQRIFNIAMTCILWMVLLGEYVNIGETYALTHLRPKTAKALS